MLLGIGLVGVLVALAAVPACSSYSEGERCQSENGDDDCQSGLSCTPAAQLTNTTSDRCCPANRSLATETVCAIPVGATGTSSDAAASADTGLSNAADSSTSGTRDAASDAISDAPSDG